MDLVANVKAMVLAVLFVDPKYTSKGCPACRLIDADDRPNHVTFSSTVRGRSGHAGVITKTE